MHCQQPDPLTARDLDKARTVLMGILEPGWVSLVQMDNVSLASIRRTAATILITLQDRINRLLKRWA